MLPLGAIVREQDQPMGVQTLKAQPVGPQPHAPVGIPLIMLFPGTHNVSISLGPPATPRELLTLLAGALLSSVFRGLTGIQYVTSAGAGRGALAGILVGLGLRASAAGEELSPTMYFAVGVAILGGGWDSLLVALALILSFLWAGGWWMHRRKDWAAGALMVVGVGFDVVIGFFLASVIQVHRGGRKEHRDRGERGPQNMQGVDKVGGQSFEDKDVTWPPRRMARW
ncbi:unnamed protein product [Discosporangium mesarthrocarpum]